MNGIAHHGDRTVILNILFVNNSYVYLHEDEIKKTKYTIAEIEAAVSEEIIKIPGIIEAVNGNDYDDCLHPWLALEGGPLNTRTKNPAPV